MQLFFYYNAVVSNKANMSLQHVRLPLFLFQILRFFWIFAFISPSGCGGQLKQVNHRTECSVTSCRNMITFASKRRDRVAFILLRCQKKKKKRFPHSFLPRVPAPLLRSTSVPRWQAHFKPLSATCLIWAHTYEELKASAWSDSIWKIMAISQQPFPLPHICQEGGAENAKEHKGEKVSPGKSRH